jgi:hypothetical protein
MPRPRLEVADIFRAHGPAYRREHAGHLNLPQLKVMSAIENCRTAEMRGKYRSAIYVFSHEAAAKTCTVLE